MNTVNPSITDFKANRESIMDTQNLDKVIQKTETLEQCEDTAWKHQQLQSIDKIADDYSKIIYFGEPGELKGQLIQGNQKNINIINAICVINSHQSLYDNVIFRSDKQYHTLKNYQQEQGVFAIKMNKNRKQKYSVLIDKEIRVCQLASKQEIPWLTRCHNMQLFSPILLEKAYNKLMALQSPLQVYPLQTVVRDMTALDLEYFNISQCNNDQLFYKYVGFCKEMNYFVGLIDVNLNKKNKMMVVDALIDINSVNYLGVSSYWKGEFIKDQENTYKGDMSLKQIKPHFDYLVILRDFPSNFNGYQFQIQQTVQTLQQQQQPWQNNQQLIISIDKKAKIVFRAYQTDIVNNQELCQIGFFLFKLNQNEDKVKTLNYKQLIYNTKVNIGSHNQVISFFKTLDKGKYSAIIFATNKEHIQFVNLEVYTDLKTNSFKFFNQTGQQINNLDIILEQELEQQQYQQRVIKNKRQEINQETLQKYRIYFDEYLNNKELLFDDLFIPHAVDFFTEKIQTIKPKKQVEESQETKVQDNLMQTFENEQLMNNFMVEGEQGKEQQQDGIYDLDDFLITDEGLQALTEVILSKNSIEIIKLRNNKLTNISVIQLLDQLDEGHHYELKELDLSENQLDQKMQPRFINLKKILFNGNIDVDLKKLNQVYKII